MRLQRKRSAPGNSPWCAPGRTEAGEVPRRQGATRLRQGFGEGWEVYKRVARGSIGRS